MKEQIMAGHDENRLHLVSHTHWDREWYLTFQQFRIRMVLLVDELLDILDSEPDYKYFMLDGQTSILEDYLEIRPENAERLRRYIGTGRILIGPWYVLPDEFLVSGEALIRNLLVGKKAAADFGPVMNVGYLPDQFGHVSQIPQILKLAGMDSAVIWRGVGDDDGQELESEFCWESPDGSQVLALCLPADRPVNENAGVPAQGEICLNEGYFNAAKLSVDPQAAARRIEILAGKLKQYAKTKHLLLMNGVDHARPQRELPGIIKGVNEILSDSRVEHSTLPLLFEAIRAENPKLRTIVGEFRRRRECDVLMGTLSARTYIKQENAKAQTDIERFTEPFTALAWLMGEDYPQPYLDLAWKLLLQNHPHDSICGCSVDAVHEEMLTRYASCRQITGELLIKALHGIADQVDLSFLGDDEQVLVMFNPSVRNRSETVEAKICFPADAGVRGFTLHDLAGSEIPFTVVREERYEFEFSPTRYLGFDKVDRFTVSFPVSDIPAIGYRCYIVRPAEPLPAEATSSQTTVLENEHLKVEVHPDGSFDLLDKKTGRQSRGCNLLEDGADAGDFYNYSPPPQDEIIRGLKNGRITASSLDTITVEGELHLPKSVSEDRNSRDAQQVCCPVMAKITLRQRRVDVCLTIDNQAKDHRLRTLFPTGVKADQSHACGQFDVVSRPIGKQETGHWYEYPLPTHPQEGFVDVNDGETGAAMFTHGLHEFEAIPGPNGVTLAITLLRCVEAITRSGLTTTNRNQGDPAWCYSPGGQCLGRQEFHYAVFPHAGDWVDGGVLPEAEAYRLPCCCVTKDRNDSGSLPAENNLLSIQPDFLELSALKRSEDGTGLIVRLVNLTEKTGQATLRLNEDIIAAAMVNLMEEDIDQLPVSPDGTVTFQYGKKQIITIKINPT